MQFVLLVRCGATATRCVANAKVRRMAVGVRQFFASIMRLKEECPASRRVASASFKCGVRSVATSNCWLSCLFGIVLLDAHSIQHTPSIYYMQSVY